MESHMERTFSGNEGQNLVKVGRVGEFSDRDSVVLGEGLLDHFAQELF